MTTLNFKSIFLSFAAVLAIYYFTGGFLWFLKIIWSLGIISLKVLLCLAAGLIGMGIFAYFNREELKIQGLIRLQPNETIFKKTKDKLHEYKFIPRTNVKYKALISRNVDDVIDELISLLLRDYVTSWYSTIVREPSLLDSNLKPVIRQMLFTFRNKCQTVDDVKLFTTDIVNILTQHLQNVRLASSNSTEEIQAYRVSTYLENKEKELNYLRKISEFLLATLLPPPYAKCYPLRHLLREIFASSVFYSVMGSICNPDLINRRLIRYFKSVQDSAEKHARTYAYAETYEDFIKMIQECDHIDGLQRMRYYIVSEIMEATAISNYKRSKGIDADKELNTGRRNKGDLLYSRNLTRFLNQLRFAKGICEKKLKLLGGPDYVSSTKLSDLDLEDKISVPGKKVLLMAVIMQSKFCRVHFSKFLQKEEMHGLLGFWEAVEELKAADKSLWHQLGNDIFRMYIHNQGIKLSKNTMKGIDEFLMANKGPDAFFEAQSEVYKRLENDFYASFIVSDIYHKMLSEAELQGIDFIRGMKHHSDSIEDELAISPNQLEKSDDSTLYEHSSYARTQLKILRVKLNNKRQALNAAISNTKCDKKVTSKLDHEIAELSIEQKLLENHIEKTELWIKYLGLWQATIGQAVIQKENDKSIPYCNIIVHLSNEAGHPEHESVGWIVSRNLNSFHALHQKLVPAAAWLKKIELPTRPFFKSLDKNYLEKLKGGLQTFLLAVTKDDGLNKSEALYSFLIPSPDHMKHSQYGQKKNVKFSISQIFKGLQGGQTEDSDEEDLLFFDETDSKEDRKDSIAEPLYLLIGEIFELKGVFNWIRRTLITFVQLTYGKTINKQLHETVSWITSEPMLLYYLQMFRDTMWPNSKTENEPISRSRSKQLEIKLLAMQMLCDNIPDVLSNLVGQQNAKKGVLKIFEALQNETLNKQLLYNIFEAFLNEYEPELRTSSKRPSVIDV